MSFHVPEQYRFEKNGHPYSSTKEDGNYGAFMIPFESSMLAVIASCGEIYGDWEHVSVSLKNRIPNWREMCFVKNLFWDTEDCVIQYHPPESKYVNNHPNVLHLWRPRKEKIPMPPLELV